MINLSNAAHQHGQQMIVNLNATDSCAIKECISFCFVVPTS